MKPFGVPQARHYCHGFSPPSRAQSFRTYAKTLSNTSFTEGSSRFDEYRASALQDAERSLYIAVSHYRRTLDLLLPSSAAWATVTCYYGSFHSARALMHLFGCAVINKRVVDVDHSAAGSQRLRIRSIKSQSLTTQGSHREFWELFYKAMTPVRPLVDSSLRFGLTPGPSPTWLIDQRNELNYDSFHYLDAGADFARRFDPDTFPGSLPGLLATQYQVLEALLLISLGFFEDFNLRPQSLPPDLGSGDLKEQLKTSVYAVRAPSLVRKTRKAEIVGR